MNKRGLGFWDVLAWLVLAGIVLWVILKVVGIIHTPLWIEYAPVGGILYLAGWAMHKLESLGESFKDLKGNLITLNSDMGRIKHSSQCPAFKN